MGVYFLETNGHNPWKNLALEKALSERLQKGDAALYLWQNDRTVVIGRNQNALKECRAQLLEEEGGYLARRSTGGGAVYHDLGNLCFTFAASPEVYDLKRQMGVVQRACASFGICTSLSGRNDIVTEEGLKFSGNAFSVTKRCNIQHGTLLINVDTERMGRYLTPSREKMSAKGVKSVQSRVCNLKELNADITADAMKRAMKEAFQKEYGEFAELTEADLDAETLAAAYGLYSSWDWRYGKSPECEAAFEKRFPWGEVEVHLTLKNLSVRECRVYTDSLDTEFSGRMETYLMGRRVDAFGQDLPEKKDGQPDCVGEVAAWLRSVL